ncbi:excinuclease ABC subunit A domain protein [Anaplasma phagocytophilum str. ApWI1]|uniref:UvrABC system protein A n=1 Tax=Anaplasma phagocytophilum str. ApWI1 TaxID=1359155 RepID=A0A0F3PV52_ANAPH|nr:excinuclease ABC subunit A domain protein [Anaplasma phagocytophilum str. ApWI1]
MLDLTGVLYVLDEPSIGLHQRDNALLIETLKNLRDLENTVVVIEHDEETMMHADHIVDVGPGQGLMEDKLLLKAVWKRFSILIV